MEITKKILNTIVFLLLAANCPLQAETANGSSMTNQDDHSYPFAFVARLTKAINECWDKHDSPYYDGNAQFTWTDGKVTNLKINGNLEPREVDKLVVQSIINGAAKVSRDASVKSVYCWLRFNMDHTVWFALGNKGFVVGHDPSSTFYTPEGEAILTWYCERAKRMVTQNWHPPLMQDDRGRFELLYYPNGQLWGGRKRVDCRIELTIAKDGHVLSHKILHESDSSDYNQAALQAVLSPPNYVPLPDPGPSAITLTFTFGGGLDLEKVEAHYDQDTQNNP